MADETKVYPLMPLRDVVLFPKMTTPLYVGRKSSIAALNAALSTPEKEIILVSQKDGRTDAPKKDAVHKIGTVAKIVQNIKLPDDTVKILVEGRARVRITKFTSNAKYFEVEAEELNVEVVKDPLDVKLDALVRSVFEIFSNYINLSGKHPENLVKDLDELDDYGEIADTMVSVLPLTQKIKQEILELVSVEKRYTKILRILTKELEILEIEKKIRKRVKNQIKRNEKEFYLNEQMKAIQNELDNGGGKDGGGDPLLKKIEEKDLPEHVRKQVLKEHKNLKMMPPMSAEATVIRNYIDCCLEVPWNEASDEILDITQAESILNEDHFGLEKPKDRILEYLSVHKLVENLKGPILCLSGPPGIGKTSLAKSIARATGREFVRMSLGGVRDESEIRGHRRTYIGAMPGKIIQSLKKVGTNNPVFLLDEIDKLSSDFRGDPASALLEVLDPHQNTTFVDHYLDLDFDLSKVMFVCTANDLHRIPGPLQDRLEIIQLPSYTEEEKLKIATNYLIPRQKKENGVDHLEIQWSESATRKVIREYTREAGVRTLERQVSAVCRKLARKFLTEKDDSKVYRVTSKHIPKMLGKERYKERKPNLDSKVGLVNGLAWTAFGGDTLQIEVGLTAGDGKIQLTGKLGDVMKESAQTAFTYVRSRASALELKPKFHKGVDIHVHVPEGAVPKDGPSAGITMTTALVSALTKIPVRGDVAMTGEVTLTGQVLAIGGLKEKAMAAFKKGITHIIMPAENEKDIEDIPKSVADNLTFHPVQHVDEVLKLALNLKDKEKESLSVKLNTVTPFDISAESEAVEKEADSK